MAEPTDIPPVVDPHPAPKLGDDRLILSRRLLARQMAQRVDGLTVSMAGAALEAVLESMAQALAQGGEVRLSGFGTFWVRQRRQRTTRHPRTGQPVQIPAARIPMFRPSPQLHHQISSASDPKHPQPSDPINEIFNHEI